MGYVLRGFGEGGRYLTLTRDKDRFYGLLRAPEPHPKLQGVVVLVEDMLSGLRMREICDVLVLCGTELRPSALAALAKEGYQHAIVFLDADNPTVKMKARKIAQRLSWMKTSIIETGSDPKHYPKTTLEEMIHEQV